MYLSCSSIACNGEGGAAYRALSLSLVIAHTVLTASKKLKLHEANLPQDSHLVSTASRALPYLEHDPTYPTAI
jgi:hypothetical protein